MSYSPCQAEGGAEGIRTPDLRLAKAAFSQLNYGPSAAYRSLNTHSTKLEIRVGLCGLEPQTFPLSEGCSNQLS